MATTEPKRAEAIRELIKKQNVAGLEFRVVLLDEIKREVMEKCCG